MGPNPAGQFFAGLCPLGEHVGNAELRCDMDELCDQPTVNHPD